MALNAVIDNDIHEWGDLHEEEIEKKYSKIIKVGRTEENGQILISAESKDEKIGNFCLENNCDLFTGDKEAYTKIFKDARIKTVQITFHDVWDNGKRPIYLVKLI